MAILTRNSTRGSGGRNPASTTTDEADLPRLVDGKERPALVLTGAVKRENAGRVTVAPISSTIRGSTTEIVVGPAEGLDHTSVVKCDNVATVPAASVRREVGLLASSRERELRAAIVSAFDLLPVEIA